MGEIIKVEIPEALAEKFRRRAMEVYGYKKGALKLALEDLIKRFVAEGEANWAKLRGRMKSQSTSVELQHAMWDEVD